MNLAKIAEALDVNLVQFFAYVSEEFEVTDSEAEIQKIVHLLRESTADKLQLAKKVIREIVT